MNCMENKENLYFDALIAVEKGYINIYNYREDGDFRKFYNILTDEIQQYAIYTFDGRFEKILFDELKNSIKYGRNYNQFFSAIREQLKALIVPCIIIIPLNFINDAKIS